MISKVQKQNNKQNPKDNKEKKNKQKKQEKRKCWCMITSMHKHRAMDIFLTCKLTRRIEGFI